ncbi:hypothetical protein AGOR_G00018540 [Albula goreensis]|uniref:PH domain-containing protein n=1 Tax=Albula goreensis TaxID=1534307 RepID=A0A8T3E075_9TELE|nr:hypothetical protein AGOR_G00018540 [Albula goreensis]
MQKNDHCTVTAGAGKERGEDEDTGAPGDRSLSPLFVATAESELDDCVVEKMLMARDTTRNEADKLHRKWLKHQAFMAELAQNKVWLEKIEKEGQQLIQEKPELSSVVHRKLEEIRECWRDLECTTQAKAHQLFENKANLGQNYANQDNQLSKQISPLSQMDGHQDLGPVNKQQTFKSKREEWFKEMRDLHVQETATPHWAVIRDDPTEKQAVVETRIVRLIEPLKERRRILLATKEVNQITRDLDDEILWIQERLPVAMCKEYGDSLQGVQQFVEKNQCLQKELQEHQARVEDVLNRAMLIATVQSPETDFVRDGVEQLRQLWESLCLETERRQMVLDTIFQAEQYYYNVVEVKTWLSEQEHQLMSEDRGKDEPSTLELLKRHLVMEQTIEDYAERIGLISQQCQQLLELGHPDSEQLQKQQSMVDRLYISLKDLVEERKSRLEQQYWLYELKREVDELEQWIAEREVVASSHELGQDFEQVTILQDKFTEFSSDTRALGQDRVTAVNKMVDELIDFGHADAATIAEWKDGLNEAWADLLEMMETRGQMLAASHQLHKFFADCQEVWLQIEDKRRRLPELKACQSGTATTSTLQRLMHTFEHDIQLLVTQVRQLQENAAQLRAVYAGEKAEAIARKEKEMMLAWTDLLTNCGECRVQITTVSDKLHFFSMAQDLNLWMDGLICQIGAKENPRDVSSVEMMMNYHQRLKSDIDTRNKGVQECLELGKTLLAARNPAAEEVKEKLDMLMAKQRELSDRWTKQWEELQQMLEVHQFSKEAVEAEAWLTGQELFPSRKELGSSGVDEMEQLIHRHEAFRKAAATWEEHFSLLRRLSAGDTVKAQQSMFPSRPLLGRKVFLDPQTTSPAQRTTSSRVQETIYEQVEPKPRYAFQKLPSTSVVQRLGSTVANYTPVMNWANYRSVDIKALAGEKPLVAHTPPNPAPDHLPSKRDTIYRSMQVLREVCQKECKKKEEPLIVNVIQATVPDIFSSELSRDTRGSRSDPQMDHYRLERQRKLGRQTSSEQELKARWEELPLEVREHRFRRRLERQTSSEQEGPTNEGSKKSSEQESTKEAVEKQSGGGEKRSTMAEIVEQLQEREAAQARAEAPHSSHSILDRATRPDRPRARDRPKPRRRPRPKEPETRGPARRQPRARRPFHSHPHTRPSGEIGFYKDAKNTTTPYNSEPLLNLSSCTCDVTNGYKKKKNVFALKTKDGEEYYFHARDEEDLKGWIANITTSITEHEEIAKWEKPQGATSSTEEGTRRDGDKSDKAEKSESIDKLEDNAQSQKGDTMEKSDRCSSTSGKNE